MVSNVANVQIKVICNNRPPLAGDDSVSTLEDTPVNIPVLDNDIDPEGTELTTTERRKENSHLRLLLRNSRREKYS